MVDAQFTHPMSDRLSVTRVPEGETIQPGRNESPSGNVPQAEPPFTECLGLPQLQHQML
jgi:hypothetical protein